eukprot:gene2113-2602_t
MPKIQDLIRLYGLSAKQQLSQNFLLDLNITDKICRLAGGFKDCTVIEVGAGPGGLTRSLLNSQAKKVIAVEMDDRFFPALRMLSNASEGRLEIVMGNMMDVDEAKILEDAGADTTPWEEPSKVKIIGNLPFNVGTHLMLKWIRQIYPREGLYKYGRVPMYLMFQKELTDRIAAPPGTEHYNRLSVMVQQKCNVKSIYTIPGKVFVPPPKVDASVVCIEPRITPLGEELKSPEYFEFITREIFTNKRKTLNNAVKKLGPEEHIHLLLDGIDPNTRPDSLKVEEYVKIANRFVDWPYKNQKIDLLEFRNDGKEIRKDFKEKEKIEKKIESLEKLKKKIDLEKQKEIEAEQLKEKERQEKLKQKMEAAQRKLKLQQEKNNRKLLFQEDEESNLLNPEKLKQLLQRDKLKKKLENLVEPGQNPLDIFTPKSDIDKHRYNKNK